MTKLLPEIRAIKRSNYIVRDTVSGSFATGQNIFDDSMVNVLREARRTLKVHDHKVDIRMINRRLLEPRQPEPDLSSLADAQSD
jgi:hypothetical protein